MAENNSNGRDYVRTITTVLSAAFNLTAILLVCFVLIPLTLSLSTKLDAMQGSIESFDKTAKRLNNAMDANEARIKAMKKDNGK